MKKSIKLLSAMLTLCILLSTAVLLFSCSKDDETDDTAPVGTVSTDESLSELEVKDFGGREFKMLWPQSTDGHFAYNELSSDGENASNIIENAVFERNEIVKASYNATISVEIQKYSAIPKSVETAVKAGLPTYDVAATMIQKLSSIALQGMLVDFNDLKYYDESQEWWNHDLMQSFSIVNERYFASGDVIYSDDLYPYVVYANTALAEQLQITDNFYELVRNKEWTLEKFHELAVLAVADLDDDDGEAVSSLDDRYGAVDGASFARALYYSAGKGVISLDKQGYPTWEMTPDYADSVLTKIINVWHTDNAVFDIAGYTTAKEQTTVTMNIFNSNRMLFMPGDLKAAQAFTTMDNALEDFALLPIPLWEKDGEYVCVMNEAVVLSIPTTAADTDDISLLLSAMSRESVNTLTPAFFETVLTYRYMKNAESVETLQLILDSVVPRDVADINDWGNIMSSFTALAVEGDTGFASVYQENKQAAMKALDDYITKLDSVN